MNLPFHRIHDVRWSYGVLVLPVPFTGRWLALFDSHGWHLTDRLGFHNCTTTGVY